MPLPRHRRLPIAAALLSSLLACAVVHAQPAPPAAADPRHTWDLTPLFASDAAWEAERQALLAELPAVAALRNGFGSSAASLRQSLDRLAELSRRWQRVAVYANAILSTDNRDAANQRRAGLMRAATSRHAAATAWVDTEIAALGREKVEAWIAAEPGLAPHAMRLRDVLRLAPHRLSPETESALAALQPVLGAATPVRTLLVTADIDWPTIVVDGRTEKLDAAGYERLRAHPDRAVRQQAFERFFGTYGRYANTLGAALAQRVDHGVVNARLRGYPSAIAASLAANDVPEPVLRTLVAEVNAALPVLHRYFRLRQRLLQLPSLAYHDIYPDLVPAPRSWSVDDAAALTLAAVAPLGTDYQALLRQALARRSMHVYPAPGKSSGAYHSSAYGAPPLIFLNHQDSFASLSTFAHEWGHGMHSALAQRAQPFTTAGYPLFTAEIASFSNELLLQGHLLATARDRAERLYYLAEAAERIRGGYFRQAMFAEFELAVHDAVQRGEALTGPGMTQTYCGLLRKYHGADAGVMAIDPVVCSEWAHIPHFHRPFYVYQYATSLVAASQFTQRILAGEPGAAGRYLGVLSAGGSQHPVPLLQAAGVDMTQPQPYRALAQRLGELLDEIDRLLAERG